MSNSFWTAFIIALGIISISFIIFFQNLTSVDEQNYTLIREAAEAAMVDAFDDSAYRIDRHNIRIDREKFVENFVRRFAQGANLAQSYKIEIFDVVETPPKVSIRVSSALTSNVTNDVITFDVINDLDAILEMRN